MNQKSLSRAASGRGAISLAALALLGAYAPASQAAPAPNDALRRTFASPPDNARPWVYWYFMDGNVSREGLRTDLEAMKAAGIGGAIYLEVGIGIPRGPVAFMSPEWQKLFAYAVGEAKRLGIQIALGTGPGWAGSGGPWVAPELSMQHLVASESSAVGPARFDSVLPRPQPREPFFGQGTLTPELRQKWLGFYRDEAVLAFPTPPNKARLEDTDHKALYYRAPYSSAPGTPPRIPAAPSSAAAPGQGIDISKVIVLTEKMGSDGRLAWDVPPGSWTILRLGRTPTGQTTRPAPGPGLGFESDKFSRRAVGEHLKSFTGTLLKQVEKQVGPEKSGNGGGLAMLHFDSWEMGAQNWSPGFRQQFLKRRGYDPLLLLPAMMGFVVGSVERSERFLWDLRQTSSELVIENHAGPLREYAHAHGLAFSVEPYDMNPSADLDLGAAADLPMGEFWSKNLGFDSEYSCFEAVSVGHTNGRRIIGAESFTSDSGDAWLQHPASMKAQLDWALCAGINKFVIHRYQHQPDPNRFPGMTMGPYGVHWERTQTWWDMVPAFHKYLARTSALLRQGLPSSDILYLTPEGAPQVFTPPPSALTPGLPDKRGYSFDGCSPKTLIKRARVQNGQITFPDGVRYQVLVLPQWPSMTPELLRKVTQLARDGAMIMGSPPLRSPSLQGFPACDAEVRALASRLWGREAQRKVGRGRVVRAMPEATVPLEGARWVWFAEGNPASAAPVATRYFRTSIQIEPGQAVRSAVAAMTADNSFELSVNGHMVARGDNFHQAERADIAPWLRPGANEIRVSASNIGDSPGPAGVIGAVRLEFADGSAKTVGTGASWQAAQSADGPWSAALELGASGVAPWNLRPAPEPLYPSYESTASLLGRMGVAPDFSVSGGASVRAIHRRLGDGDLYFVANAGDDPIETVATFRASGRAPEWWDAVSGQARELPSYAASGGTSGGTSGGMTRVPLRLGAHESGFVIFRKRAKRAKPAKRGGRGGRGAGSARGALLASANFPRPKVLATLGGPWQVAFDARWGGPTSIEFPTLDDWSRRPEEGIRHYSGKAIYTASFDAPAPMLAPGAGASLSLGSVKNLASVRLNGKYLGALWCEPWRVEIPAGLLKSTGNRLEVTVANLWTNRLIGDSALPPEKRFASTTFNPLQPNSPLQPSGLLGPVTLEVSAR